MAQNTNILQELTELKSSLARIAPGNIYTVPEGYFDGLASDILKRIKALEVSNAKEELSFLSPLLNDLSRQMPYAVPDGYFKDLEDNVLPAVHQSASEELESISPLLSGLNKQMPYSVPVGYFETLNTGNILNTGNQEAKVVNLFSSRKRWIKYAAAAMITGVIGLVAFLVVGKKDIDKLPIVKFEKKLNKEIQKMSDTELAEFLETTEVTMNGQENVSTNKNDEIKDLLKDIPESELKEFIEETSELEADPIVMN